jgi:hypothetical protein
MLMNKIFPGITHLSDARESAHFYLRRSIRYHVAPGNTPDSPATAIPSPPVVEHFTLLAKSA